MKVKPIFFFLLISLVGCGPTRDLVYLSDLQENEEYKVPIVASEPRIQPHDVLSITVSSLHPESNVLFNSGVLQVGGAASATNSGETPIRLNEGYQVDANGAINFPVLGKVKLIGLTREEATQKLTSEIKLHVKDPIINVRFQNFNVTVIGEVNQPATFTIPTERINILEALGLAGDLTVFGRRENVLIIRENNGERTTTRVNLNNKDLLASPYFYLQQNDIVYVEPVRSKAAQASLGRSNLSIVLSLASILAIILVNNN